MQPWEELVHRIKHPDDELTIHVVGKYTGYEDSYKSLNEALYHGGFANRLRINIQWVESEALEQEGGTRLLEGAHGDPRARRLRLARHARHDEGRRVRARSHGIPYFGICYGFQWATVEFARNVCGLDGADSTEFDEAAPHKVIYKLRDLLGVDDLGGTMRLGRYACELAPGSLARQIYGTDVDLRAAPPPLRVQLPVRAGAARERACASRAARPTASSSRSPSCPATRGSSPCSSIPSSSRGRSSRTRCSPASSSAAYQQKLGTPRSACSTPSVAGVMAGRGRCRPGPVTFGTGHPLAFILGPCVIESEAHALDIAAGARRPSPGALGVPLVFKASFDKANRTSLSSFRGPGLRRRPAGAGRGQERAPACRSSPTSTSRRRRRRPPRSPTCCRFPRSCRARPTCSWPRRGPAGRQREEGAVPRARATCGTSSPSSPRRGAAASCSPSAARRSATTTSSSTCARCRCCASSGYPVVFDVTHSLQLPGAGDGVTAGLAEYIEPLARAGVAAGVDGVFMEVHEDPRRRQERRRQRAPPRPASSRCCAAWSRLIGSSRRMPDLSLARKVLQTEAAAVLALVDRLDERFARAVSWSATAAAASS